MLTHLQIKDFAIIDDVDIQFGRGFNVITGETGAGKSILIEAVSLLLGSRGDTDFIRNKSDELVVEGVFLEDGEEVTVRRSLNRAGRSKISINGEMRTLNQLREKTFYMVDISGQHQHQMLLNEESHIEIIDRYFSKYDIIEDYKALRDEYFSLLGELKRLNSLVNERESRLDFLRYQRQEIEKIALSKEELDRLLEESNILKNSAKFQQILLDIESVLYSQDSSIISMIGRLKKKILELSKISKGFESYLSGIDDFEAFIVEFKNHITEKINKTDFSPERLDEVEGRIQQVKRICEKYKISVEELIPRLKKIETEIEELENFEIKTSDVKQRLISVFEEMCRKAELLHQMRVKSSNEVSKKCEVILQKLGFKDAKIKFDISFELPSDMYNSERVLHTGFDKVRILFAPNLGEEFRPLSKIASGGELSRVMLAFKSALSGRDRVSTYIFDEVDAGIGGAVAESVGIFLKGLSRDKQVICITHLPQIASLADDHFIVEKIVKNQRTSIKIRKLQGDERVEEIARMLGGQRITEKNREFARELLERNR
ncbi:MAG: DNA repair protein RecN [Deltaproteobacteria bacterium]|nr:DNA repair protein RecN [Deltaproteobacteria bacterium]